MSQIDLLCYIQTEGERMINIDEPWPEWSNQDSYKGMAVHALYTQPAYMKRDVGTRARCGAEAACLYTEDELRVTCKRCSRR